jgi:hypothetical protein
MSSNYGKQNASKKTSPPKTKIYVDETTTDEQLREVITISPDIIETTSNNKQQIHHGLVERNPDTTIVVLKPSQIFMSSPITPMGGTTLNFYMTLTVHPLLDQKKGEYIVGEEGTETENFLNRVINVYGTSLDANAELKETIFTKVNTDPDYMAAKMEKPACNALPPIVKKNLFVGLPLKDPKRGTENKSKSPTISTKLYMAGLKPDWDIKDNFILRDTHQVCFTSIFVPGKQPHTFVQVKNLATLEPYMYRAGDSKNGKKFFRLLVSIETKLPNVYWTSSKDSTSIGITLSKVTILGKEEIEREGLSPAEQLQMSSRAMDAAAAMGFKLGGKIENSVEAGEGYDSPPHSPVGDSFYETQQPDFYEQQGRQPKPSATVQSKPKTNPVNVYSTKQIVDIAKTVQAASSVALDARIRAASASDDDHSPGRQQHTRELPWDREDEENDGEGSFAEHPNGMDEEEKREGSPHPSFGEYEQQFETQSQYVSEHHQKEKKRHRDEEPHTPRKDKMKGRPPGSKNRPDSSSKKSKK